MGRPLFVLLGLSLSVAPACAQTGDVTFDGLILPSCTVLATTPGALGVSGDGAVLTSESGASGTATISATGLGYEATVDPPLGFDVAPADASTSTTFEASYEASGATIALGLVAGNTLSLLIGTTTLTVDAAATRSAGAFPAGIYQMTATVRCIAP